MNDLKDSIIKYINDLDRFLKFDNFTGKSLNEWMKPLLQAMTEEGAISYLLGGQNSERYRASPLASSLIWMCSAGLLPENTVDIMQNKLLFLRDNCEPMDKDPGNTEKKAEDSQGWSMAEGVSIWSTSMALIALMDESKIGLSKADSYKMSILWLVKQQKVGEKGWGYQLSANCNENVIMTSLVLRVVSMALRNKTFFPFDNDDEHLLVLALNNGFQYIKDNINYSKGKTEAYWCFEGKKHCAATVWALLALKNMTKLNISSDINVFYEENVSRGLEFVLTNIPNKCVKWEDEQIVCEAGAKYNKQKNYYSFSSTLLLDLFEIGISPFHPKVVAQIKWLIQNEDRWKIENYDKSQICSFTYAMVISTIAKWSLLVGQENSKKLLEDEKGKFAILAQSVTGMPFQKKSCVQIVKTSRITFCWIMSLLLVILAMKSKDLYCQIVRIVGYLFEVYSGSKDTIIVNVTSSAVYAIFIFVGATFLRFLGQIIRRIR